MLPGARLFSALAVVTVVTVNAAGLWSITVSKRSAVEEAAAVYRAATEARARAIEALLAGIRSDLAFLADVPPITALAASRPDAPAGERSFLEKSAESALLLFLRAHAEVTRVTIRSADGAPRMMAGRRGGIPILWLSVRPTGDEGAAVSPLALRLTTVLPLGPEVSGPPDVAVLEAEVTASLLLVPRDTGGQTESNDRDRPCRLVDGGGPILTQAGSSFPDRPLQVTATVKTEGWSPPPPWRLQCQKADAGPIAAVEPVTARYRTTLALNLGAMTLALLLGIQAVREVTRRERVEAQAREEARVRDLERQLFHAERLATVGRLAAGIAHEINNPLEGMTNYLSLARDALERRDFDTAKRRLDGVAQGLERAASVVRLVLTHADPAKAPPSPVDLNQVLAETTEFVRSRPEFANVHFAKGLSEAPLVVEGSPIMLGQVALNLIVNACEAQPGGGEVQVTSRRERDSAMAEVADRGPGVGAADRERIFEPFLSTKNSTGLGLFICHSIVQRHGGTIEALPREGGGSVFRMTLPLMNRPAEVA